ncbi:MFS transporter [Streptomyces galbus]|uniref:MFS transporter n=1 Tax=Streptomyces galbus TaxID=33898 RepID=A0A4U5WYD5_STRGB|nr:MFS transporter [Streptomyces galbus]TKT05956.1 MFS transporter [Streptomyces galbus]GHD54748.1 MFS transporter [Streptomyces galbus]
MATESAAVAAGPSSGAAADARRRWLIGALICTAYLMIGLDLTVMNVALPSAQEALDFSNSDRQWVVTAYALPFGGLMLFCGRLSDLIGRKQTFLIGLLGFAVASAIGGAANNFEMLVTARALQGAFAAMLSPVCMALLTTTFTDPKERAKAFGIFSGVVASGSGLGLIIGGALTTGLSWRWCMYVNLFLAGIALVGGLVLLQAQPRTGARMDIPGVVLASGGMFSVVLGFSNAHNGWSESSTWGFIVLGAVLLIAFSAWQTRAAHPLLPPRIVIDRTRGAAYFTVLLVGAGLFGILLFLVYYMQTNLGYSAITSGCALLPMIALTPVGTSVGAIKLLPKYGPRPLIAGGLLVTAVGMALLTRIDENSGYATHLLLPLLLVGMGMGLIYGAALSTGTFGVAPQEAGIASAVISTGQQLGGAVGAALLNTIAATTATDWLAGHVQGKPTAQQLGLASIHGDIRVFWWCTAIFAVGAVVAAVMLPGGPLPAPAGAPAEQKSGKTEPAPS